MQANDRNRTIALAALFQCVEGVVQIASKGSVDSGLLKTCIDSVITKETDTIDDIYGGLPNLEKGFRVLMYQLGSNNLSPDKQKKNLESTRYSINLLYLEKKLAKQPETFQTLLDGITEAQNKLEFFDETTHSSIIGKLADVYSQTISTLGPKIMVKGEPDLLSVPENANKIRALLLAGIRAALLWRQAGGTRWKLLLSRRKMQREAEGMLREIVSLS